MAHDDHVYKLIELTGTSAESIEGAINSALARAAKTIHNIRWFQVMETRGCVKESEVEQYQVTIKVGFTLDDKATA